MFRKFFPPLAIIAFISTALVFSWFRYGHIYGGGDVGLPSYNPLRVLEILQTLWWEATAPGTIISNAWTSIPMHIFQSLLQTAGLPFFIIQAFLFWLILFFMGVGMFFVAVETFGKDKLKFALIAAIFYMLNPYMMINVWHRFIHNTFFLSVLLPWLFLFWIKWLKSERYLYLLLLILINFFCVYVYGTIAFIITIFLILLIPSVLEVFIPWKGIKYTKLILKRSGIGSLFFILTNIWWGYPLFNIAPAILSTQHTISNNLTTLISISQQAIIPYSILGINPFYIFSEKDWGAIYMLPVMILIMGLSLLFLIPGFINSLKDKKVIFWPLLLLIAVVISKGGASPFGYPYLLGFDSFFGLGLLRNPFEKLGIFIPFSQAILFTLGVELIWIKFHKKFRKSIFVFFGICFFIIFFINLWPMWTGQLFGKYDKLALVEIPESYKTVNQFIKSQKKNEGNILNLPLYTKEGVSYKWNFGYGGVEPSPLIFDSLPSIWHGFNVSHIDNSIQALSDIFARHNQETYEKILNLLQSFNVRYIVLHKDVNWKEGDLEDPDKLILLLDKLPFLQKELEVGKLVLYTLKDQYYKPILYLTEDVQYLERGKIGSYWPWLLRDSNGTLLSPLNDQADLVLFDKSNQIIAAPKNMLTNYDEHRNLESALAELPAASISSDSPLIFLKRIKENFQALFKLNYQLSQFKLTLAGKRLVEAYKSQLKNAPIKGLLDEYKKLIVELDKRGIFLDKDFLKIELMPLSYTFKNHLALISEIKSKSEGVNKKEILETENFLLSTLHRTNILPNYPIENDKIINVWKFNLPKDDDYEILFNHRNVNDIFPNKLANTILYIDGNPNNYSGEINKDTISYKKVALTKGVHEIGIESTPSANILKLYKSEHLGNVKLLDNDFEILTGDRDSSYIDLPVDQMTTDSNYVLSFEAFFKKGDNFIVQLVEDNDPWDSKKEEFITNYSHFFDMDKYIHDWKKYEIIASTRHSATKASFRILVNPWSDCELLIKNKSKCNDPAIKVRYQRPSQIEFRNIKITRDLNNPFFLKTEIKNLPSVYLSDDISFEKRTPTLYSGKINIKSPAFLIFSQSYHSGWQLKTYENNNSTTETKRYLANGFGNGWYLEKPGIYSFELEFEPQKNMTKYIHLSIIALFALVSLSVIKELKYERKISKN